MTLLLLAYMAIILTFVLIHLSQINENLVAINRRQREDNSAIVVLLRAIKSRVGDK